MIVESVNWKSRQAQGLIAFYPCSAGGGPILKDLSRRPHNATLGSTVKWIVGNMKDPAIQFSGSNNCTITGGNEDVYGVSLRFKPTAEITSASTQQGIFVTGSGNFSIEFGSSTSFLTNEVIAVTSLAVTPFAKSGWTGTSIKISPSWHHLAISWNGSYYDIYFDGILRTNATSGTNVLRQFSSGTLIGKNASFFFTGLVSDVRVYGRPFSESDVFEMAYQPEKIWIPNRNRGILSPAPSGGGGFFSRHYYDMIPGRLANV